MTIRRRLRELEARVAELEEGQRFNGEMPPAPTILSDPVETHALWRERCVEYGAVTMVDVEDDRARTGVYL